MNDYLDQLQGIEKDIDRLPPGDERAEKVRLADRARSDIVKLDGGSADYKIEKRLNDLLEQLKK